MSSLAVQREGRSFLFDCGEGTQRQMMRYGVGFSLTDILVTHLHSDHYLGVTGLLRTMSLQGRTEPLMLWGPIESTPLLETLRDLGGERLAYEVPIRELAPGDALAGDGFRIEAFETQHTRHSIGLAVIEDDRPGRFDVDRARALGVPEGPAFGRLHRGETVETADGRRVGPDEVVGPARPGRLAIYTGDTRPGAATIEIARGADLLIHEATFDDSEAERAVQTGHSTAREAAEVARVAGVGRLVLTHLSSRYADRPGELLDEARAVFSGTEIARDGLVLEVGFQETFRDVEGTAGA